MPEPSIPSSSAGSSSDAFENLTPPPAPRLLEPPPAPRHTIATGRLGAAQLRGALPQQLELGVARYTHANGANRQTNERRCERLNLRQDSADRGKALHEQEWDDTTSLCDTSAAYELRQHSRQRAPHPHDYYTKLLDDNRVKKLSQKPAHHRRQRTENIPQLQQRQQRQQEQQQQQQLQELQQHKKTSRDRPAIGRTTGEDSASSTHMPGPRVTVPLSEHVTKKLKPVGMVDLIDENEQMKPRIERTPVYSDTMRFFFDDETDSVQNLFATSRCEQDNDVPTTIEDIEVSDATSTAMLSQAVKAKRDFGTATTREQMLAHEFRLALNRPGGMMNPQ